MVVAMEVAMEVGEKAEVKEVGAMEAATAPVATAKEGETVAVAAAARVGE